MHTPASSYASGSNPIQWLPATSSLLQPGHGSLSSHSISSRSAGKRKHIDASLDVSDDGLPSKRPSRTPAHGRGAAGMSSAIVGMTGAMNNLSTTLQQSVMQSGVSITQQATHLVNEANDLTAEEKAELCFYFCNQSAQASSLPAMSKEVRQATFRLILQRMK